MKRLWWQTLLRFAHYIQAKIHTYIHTYIQTYIVHTYTAQAGTWHIHSDLVHHSRRAVLEYSVLALLAATSRSILFILSDLFRFRFPRASLDINDDDDDDERTAVTATVARKGESECMPGNKIVLGAACTLAALLAHPFGDVVVAAAAAAVVAAVDEPDSSSMYRCDDGTLINASLVNDFFCDCGSDEPRTAACSHVHTAKFLCREDGSLNEGRFIPSSRVNDAICDCCDGSDEDVSLATGDRARAASLGYSERKQSATACPNTCTTLSEDDVKLIRRLAPTRKALVTEARAALAERSARIQHMKEEYPTILTKIEQLKESLLHLEELEAADAVAHAHRHSDALVHKLGLQDFSAQEAFLLFFQYLSAQLETTPGAGRRADAKKNVAFSFGKAPSRTFFAHLLDARPKNSIPSKYVCSEYYVVNPSVGSEVQCMHASIHLFWINRHVRQVLSQGV